MECLIRFSWMYIIPIWGGISAYIHSKYKLKPPKKGEHIIADGAPEVELIEYKKDEYDKIYSEEDYRELTINTIDLDAMQKDSPLDA